MGLGKRTIKIVTKELGNAKKRKLYTQEEILYMERQVELLKIARERRKEARKREKGFANE